MKKIVISFCTSLLFVPLSIAQLQVDKDSITVNTCNTSHFNFKSLIVPVALIGYGVIGIESDQIQLFNKQIRDEVTEDIDEKISIDDFSQYAPAVSVYALNLAGVKGKNNMHDRSVILATSYVILSSTVLGLKSITKVERPDGSSKNSFPSGHTATAFAGAEFLRQEYGDQSIWYGIAGYAVATGTGLFRMYNNRHWLTDVAAGAGIGILSTKIAYWVNPYLTRKIFGEAERKSTVIFTPIYDGQHVGVGMVKTF